MDLAFASPGLFQCVDDWAVDHDNNPGSDHELIWFTVTQWDNEESYVNHPRSQPYVWKEVDWDYMLETVGDCVAEVQGQIEDLCTKDDVDENDVDKAVELLTEALQAAMARNLKRRKQARNAKRWWTDELAKARKDLNVSRRRAQHTRGGSDYADYKRKRIEYQRLIKATKADCCFEYLGSLKGTQVLEINRYLKPKATKKIAAIRDDNMTYTNWEDKERVFLRDLFPRMESQQGDRSQHIQDALAQSLRRDLGQQDVLLWSRNSTPTQPDLIFDGRKLQEAIMTSSS